MSVNVNPAFPPAFEQRYETHLKHLKLKGLQPKTIQAYARAIRRMAEAVRPNGKRAK